MHFVFFQTVLTFVISVVCITFAILSAIVALLSGISCSGGNIQYTSTVNGVSRRIDPYKFCLPNDSANAAIAFVDIALCVLLAILTIFGMVFFCVYARYSGLRRRVVYYGY